MIMTGESIDAKEALWVGLIKDIYSPETLLEEAIILGSKMAWMSMTALSYAK